jgi:hypothetical protein
LQAGGHRFDPGTLHSLVATAGPQAERSTGLESAA